LMMSLWDALRMNMMISYQELVRTFPSADYPVIDRIVNSVKINSVILAESLLAKHVIRELRKSS
ncbi:hypothetical protein V6154_26060, partial [Klebsiella pneumoniae]